MEQVFDFREFVIMMVKKFKLVIILGLIFAVLGAIFGYIKYPDTDLIKTTSSASLSITDKTQDATALANAATNVNAVVTYDTFYVGVLEQLAQTLNEEEMNILFEGDRTPKITDLKEYITMYVKGNVVYADVTSHDEEVSQKASKLCIDYAIEQIPTFSEDVAVKFLQQQNVNLTKQNNDTLLKSVLLYGILGLVGGIVIGVLWVFFVDIFDLRVKTASDLRKYGLPVLGEPNLK